MDKSVEKQIKKFVLPPWWKVILAVFIFIPLMYFLLYDGSKVTKILCAALDMLALCCCVGYQIHRAIFIQKKLEQIDRDSLSLVLANDFCNAGRAFKNSVIMGDRFIIPKQSGYILSYDDIARIWQVTQSMYGTELHHIIYIIDKNGRKRQFFYVPSKQYNSAEYQSVIGYILSKNPNIKLGEP